LQAGYDRTADYIIAKGMRALLETPLDRSTLQAAWSTTNLADDILNFSLGFYLTTP
jgi:hypothetical protein